MSRVPRPPALSTFGIGSLPHTQQDLAMQLALSLDIPTLPQLPKGNPAELMLSQALEGLPGLQIGADGKTTVDRKEWEAGRSTANDVKAALAGKGLERFEPSGAFCRAWKPFLWEVEQRKAPFAKAQIAGPLTALWVSTLTTGEPLTAVPGLESFVAELILARALAMVSALRATGATPIFFVDEPGLFAYDKARPSHIVQLREIGVMASLLRWAGALVGVHCCGNTDWAAVLKLGLDFVSVDFEISLEILLSTSPVIEEYLAAGGWLGLGIVPTNVTTHDPVGELVDRAKSRLGERGKAILARSILSPACGLGLRTVAEAEEIYGEVREAQRLLRA